MHDFEIFEVVWSAKRDCIVILCLKCWFLAWLFLKKIVWGTAIVVFVIMQELFDIFKYLCKYFTFFLLKLRFISRGQLEVHWLKNQNSSWSHFYYLPLQLRVGASWRCSCSWWELNYFHSSWLPGRICHNWNSKRKFILKLLYHTRQFCPYEFKEKGSN